MTAHTAKRGEKLYHYYHCHRRVDYGRNSCKQRMARAEKAEQAMWEFVSRAMKDPGRIVAGMDALIEQKRASMHGDPTREAKTWLEKLAEVDQERRGYQRLAAKGHMTDEELNEALLELEETRQTAERELEALRHRQEEVEALERDRDAMMASWAAAVPDDLDRLTPEQRNTLYHMLRLEIRPTEEGYEITGPFVTEPLCTSETLTILEVTHHGSNTSSTPLFLSRFPPKVAVIQCGADNPYGHPTPETLDRLQRVGAKVFRNDEDGDVIATIKDQELKVATTKR